MSNHIDIVRMKYIQIIILLFGTLVSLYCMYMGDIKGCPIYLLPIAFTVCVFFLKLKTNDFQKAPGIITLHVAMSCRYLILPLSISLNGCFSTIVNDYSYMNDAVYLMVYEMITMFMMLYYVKNKFTNRNHESTKVNDYCVEYHISDFIIVISVIVLVYIGVYFKSLGAGLQVFISGLFWDFNDIMANESSLQSLMNIVWQVLCMFLYIAILFRIKYLKWNETLKLNASILLSFFFILLAFIDQTGLSRWYTILTSTSCISSLLLLYSGKKKSILTLMCMPVVLLVLLTTMIKNGDYAIGSGDYMSSLKAILDPTALDIYFSGPAGVNNSMGLSERTAGGLSYLFPDMLQSMPIVNHWTSAKHTTMYTYNLYVGRLFTETSGDQIIPLIGQGYIYFGYILSPILSMLSILLISWSDNKYLSTNSYSVYLYAFLSVWTAVQAMALDMTIFFSWMYIRILPFAFFIYCINKISQKRMVRYVKLKNV